MDTNALRAIIRRKLADGQLPDDLPRVWGCAGTGEECDACGELITTSQYVLEGINPTTKQGLQLHPACFSLWDMERHLTGREDHGQR